MNSDFLNNLADDLFKFLILAKNNLINENELIKHFPTPPKEVKSFIDKYPMPPSHIKVIIYLSTVKNASISQVASTLNITKSNTTPIIDKLISYGLVERYTDSSDRRIVRVELTSCALDIFNEIKNTFKNTLVKRISILDDEDLLKMHSCISELSVLFNKIKDTDKK